MFFPTGPRSHFGITYMFCIRVNESLFVIIISRSLHYFSSHLDCEQMFHQKSYFSVFMYGNSFYDSKLVACFHS